MSPIATEELSLRSAMPAVILTTLVQAVAAMATLSVASIAPEVASALGVPTVLVGYQASLIYGFAMVSAMLAGAFVVRYGACRISQWSMLLTLLGSTLLMVPHVAGIALGSLFIGIGYGLTNPSASHLLMRLVPVKRRSLIFSLKQTGVPLGGVMAGFILPSATIYLGWQPALGLVGLVALVLIIAMQYYQARWDDDRIPNAPLPRNPFYGLTIIWQVPVLRFVSLVAFCYGILQINLSTYLVTMLVEDIHIDLLTAGAILAAVQVAGVSGRILWGGIADWINRGLWMLVFLGVIISIMTVVVSSVSPQWSVPALYLAFILFGMTAIGWNGIYLSEVAKYSPEGQVSAATGASLSITYTGILMGSPLFIAIYQRYGNYADSFGVLLLPALIGLACAFIAAQKTKSHL
ncbi:MAG: MFS transporter [Gammaproteobacteria bacterium]|nr:MFS transporter [Gammaproteobacteria bacterium]